MILLYISIGGFIGAILRFVISKKLNRNLPYGTFLVNCIGSFLLGYFFYQGMTNSMYAFLGTGFCGAFTTFSTFKLESFQLYKSKGMMVSLTYLLLTYIVGFLIAFGGYLFANQ
jgi:fluoride exporter